MRRIFTFYLSMFMFIMALLVDNQLFAQNNNELRFEINNATNKKMSVYPTPASSFVNISIPLSLKESIDKIQILDIVGRVVLEEKIVNKSNAIITVYNLSNLANGTYIIAAKDSDGRLLQSSKLIINK